MEFKGWPKTPRLFRDAVITEKIDGTNACVIVGEDGEIGAQSRNRLITPEQDNAGFATWVSENAYELASLLGPGYHYGEWWGNGIQRGYGLANGDKRFSLFNTHRWETAPGLSGVPGLGCVPVLHIGPFSDAMVAYQMRRLAEDGSAAAPGFMRPEGVIVYHTAIRQCFKATFEADAGKWTEAAA